MLKLLPQVFRATLNKVAWPRSQIRKAITAQVNPKTIKTSQGHFFKKLTPAEGHCPCGGVISSGLALHGASIMSQRKKVVGYIPTILERYRQLQGA